MAGVPFFVRPLPFTVVAYGSQQASKPASNLGEFQYAGMTWATPDATNVDVSVDLGDYLDVDFIGVLGANALPATTIRSRLSYTGGQLTTDGYPDNVDTTTSFIVPAVTGRASYNSHHELAGVANRRFARITITGHTGPFEAAFLVVGKKVQPAMYYEPEWEAGPVDLSTIAIGRYGVPDIAPGLIQRTIGFTLGWQTEDEFQSKMQPLVNAVGKVNPVYLCFDPSPTVYRQDRTYFGRFTDNLKTTKKGWNRFERAFALQSMI